MIGNEGITDGEFNYLVSIMMEDLKNTTEIKKRITVAKEAFNKKWSLLYGKLNLD